MKNLLIITLTISFLINTALADETAGKFGLGIKAGLVTYQGDIQESNFYDVYEGFAQYWFTNHFAAAFHFNKGYVDAADEPSWAGRERYFKNEFYSYAFLAKYKPFTNFSFNPYAIAGYTLIASNPTTRSGVTLLDRDSKSLEKNNNAISVGLGSTYYLNENFGIELEFIYNYDLSDEIDGLNSGDLKDSWITATLGISYNLGKARDTDKDGIPDSKDYDPFNAEDFDNFQDEDGIPDPDNDQDGVIDSQDKAPLDPEDQDNFQDADGIPDLDNDQDGILDVSDKAPNQAEDKDGFEDEDGIPDPDNDSDGIPDTDDACPDEPENINGYEDSDGCPDKKPEMAVDKGQAIVLEGVTFASGSTQLSENAKSILDKIVRTMQSNPEIEVVIRGFTDNVGSFNSNLRISQKRADAVKTYLVSKEIGSGRVSSIGFGPDNPIAPNNTPEGRAKNRRIEFFRIN